MVWNVDPEIFHLGPVTVRWYGLMFLLSFTFGYKMMAYFFKEKGYSADLVDSLFTYVFFGTLLGARLGHCLFYEPEIYLREPLRILRVWEGGLASHGATIGILFSVWLFHRKYPMPSWLWLVDRISISTLQAATLIRIGNFFNSEIIGRPTDQPWGIVFKKIDPLPRHPTQIYEAILYATTLAIMWLLYRRNRDRVGDGWFFGVFLILAFSFRASVEFLKENQVAFEMGLPLNMGQILSLPAIAIGIYLTVSKGSAQTASSGPGQIKKSARKK